MAVLIASPHAIISEGASLIITFSLTLDERDMFENGLAMLTSHPVLAAMTSAAPSMDAQPPAITMRST